MRQRAYNAERNNRQRQRDGDTERDGEMKTGEKVPEN